MLYRCVYLRPHIRKIVKDVCTKNYCWSEENKDCAKICLMEWQRSLGHKELEERMLTRTREWGADHQLIGGVELVNQPTEPSCLDRSIGPRSGRLP
jgi:hypothetical protein